MGSAASIRHPARLSRDGIDCVVDLREEGADVREWPPKILICHIPLADHGTPTIEALEAAATVVADLVKQGHGVLVHCQAGIERSPMVVCAALVTMGWTLTEAYQRVVEVRPEAAPTDGQLAALRTLAAGLGP
jgi:protein-tyrosine phosphatase